MVRQAVIFVLPSVVAGQDLFLSARTTNSTCAAYAQGPYAKCDTCESCFNAGARQGVLCQGGGLAATGYLCPPDAQGGDMAFACMDWTFGSSAMQAAESQFKATTGDQVRFGVGTFGSGDDPLKGIGNCYRITTNTSDIDLIVQSINTGSDVAGDQFDLQVGDGGAGIFDACVGGDSPGSNTMFPGSKDVWGNQYGGVSNRADCAKLPKYPEQNKPMQTVGDDLVSLCEYSFDQGMRGEGGSNPTILSIGRVQCPEELVQMTQIQRSDDPFGYVPASPLIAEHECQSNIPGMQNNWCLTRMMDCRKPSGAWRSNSDEDLTMAGRRLVQTCTSDGYTRIDNQCGCFDCDC